MRDAGSTSALLFKVSVWNVANGKRASVQCRLLRSRGELKAHHHSRMRLTSEVTSRVYLVPVQPFDFDHSVVTHIHHCCRIPQAFPRIPGHNWVIFLIDLLRSCSGALLLKKAAHSASQLSMHTLVSSVALAQYTENACGLANSPAHTLICKISTGMP